MKTFQQVATSIGNLVTNKNQAYGNSFEKSEQILKVLYPEGIQPEQYQDLLTITRIIDKLFRIATDKDALGEDPWKDICGYALLATTQNINQQ
tara:strand:+ start:351 stop:629 length:279 start_codon:yes stop_codon:yes gene_type:complete